MCPRWCKNHPICEQVLAPHLFILRTHRCSCMVPCFLNAEVGSQCFATFILIERRPWGSTIFIRITAPMPHHGWWKIGGIAVVCLAWVGLVRRNCVCVLNGDMTQVACRLKTSADGGKSLISIVAYCRKTVREQPLIKLLVAKHH